MYMLCWGADNLSSPLNKWDGNWSPPLRGEIDGERLRKASTSGINTFSFVENAGKLDEAIKSGATIAADGWGDILAGLSMTLVAAGYCCRTPSSQVTSLDIWRSHSSITSACCGSGIDKAASGGRDSMVQSRQVWHDDGFWQVEGAEGEGVNGVSVWWKHPGQLQPSPQLQEGGSVTLVVAGGGEAAGGLEGGPVNGRWSTAVIWGRWWGWLIS